MKERVTLLLLFFVLGTRTMWAQIPVAPALLSGAWPSSWITCPGSTQREYGIYHFRKSFQLDQPPQQFIIHVSADNRYRLFVNGTAACSGPARGDLFNWYFETIDIASFLKPGNNVIAAQVWNMGVLAPVAQISNQTGFVLQGNGPAEQLVNTDLSWKVMRDSAYSATSLDNMERLKAYMVVGPGDQIDGRHYPWGWQNLNYPDQGWKAARIVATPYPVGYGTDNRWTLAPRNIPFFKETLTRFAAIRRSSLANTPKAFLQGTGQVTIPPNQTVKLLVDQGVNVVAYPVVKVSEGRDAVITMTYAEALFDTQGRKGNRNDINGKTIRGNYDVFISDGGEHRIFRPLWIRAYRYLELEICTGNSPLVLEDCYGMATGYPLEMKASFASSDTSLQQIWNVGWRTARLCAGDLYYDTPYYEQLQYTGDSRIQSLISLYLSGDDRLMRKAITDFYHSRTPEGLTQGRYPSSRLQIIPTFSLFWVNMVHDYWMHRRDDEFVKQFLPAISEVLHWYENHTDPKTGMLGPMTWWNFVDWDNFNGWGIAPGAEPGHSAIISLQYAATLHDAAELMQAFGEKAQSNKYSQQAQHINSHTYAQCFDAAKLEMGDTPEKKTFSQHAGIWAILSDAIPQNQQQAVMAKILSDPTLGQATFFYRFYLTRAMKKAAMAERYYRSLGPWREMLKLGLTTFAEKPEPTRSDCHAWSASPDYDFLATICGIMPGAPGFKKVLIQPALGELTEVKGSMPHPDGTISVSFKRRGAGLEGEITLPETLSGTFSWNQHRIALHGGVQQFNLK